MGNEQSYFLVPVTSGLCIEPNRGYYDLLYTAIPDQKNLNQQWTLERQGSKVAFRNAEKKDYLKALGNHNQAQVRMQATPQWWSLEPGRTAGSFWIKSEDVGGYLCNPHGYHTENNMQWMWSWKEPVYTQRLLFYLQDVRSLNGSPDLVLSAGSGAQGSQEEVQAREQERKDKEAEIATKEKQLAEKQKKLDNIEASEKALKQRQREVEAKEKELTEKQKKLEEVESREKKMLQREKDFEAKEKEAAQKQEKLDDLTKKQKEFEARQKSFEAQQRAAAEKQSKLEEREKKIAAKETGLGKGGKASKESKEEMQSQVAELQAQLSEANAALEKSKRQEEECSAAAKDATVKGDELARAQEQIKQLRADLRRQKESSSPGEELAQTQRQIKQLQQDLRKANDSSTGGSSGSSARGTTGSDPSSTCRTKPSSDDPFASGGWTSTSPLAARATRSSLSRGAMRKEIPGLRTGGDGAKDARWTANAPGAERVRQKEPKGMRTAGQRRGEERPIHMPRELGHLLERLEVEVR